MSGGFPAEIHSLLEDQARFPISGYKTVVAWDTSALGDFTFLSMLLLRHLEPPEAVQQAILVAPFLGEERLPNAQFAPLGLSVLVPGGNHDNEVSERRKPSYRDREAADAPATRARRLIRWHASSHRAFATAPHGVCLSFRRDRRPHLAERNQTNRT